MGSSMYFLEMSEAQLCGPRPWAAQGPYEGAGLLLPFSALRHGSVSRHVGRLKTRHKAFVATRITAGFADFREGQGQL